MIARQVRELYRLARTCRPDEFTEAALKSIGAALAFDSAIIGVAVNGAKPVPSVQHAFGYRIDPAATREWMDAGLDLADRVTALARTEYWRAHRIHARSFFDRRKEAAVLDYARRHGRENFLTMAIPLGPLSRFQWTSLYRARAGAAYDDDEVRACEALMPHFTEAFQINQAVSGSARPVAGETAMSGNAIALADPRGHLLHQERRFLDLLSQEWAALDTPRLPRPVVESRAFSSGGRIEGRKIVVTVRRSIGLIILYARSKRRIELLPRQRATAVRLYSSGRTSKEIARRMQLSPATVRNHLAAAYRDLGIGSRTELCDLIASEAHSDPVD